MPRTMFGIGPQRRSGKSLNNHCPNKAMASDWAKPHASLTWPLLTPQYCL